MKTGESKKEPLKAGDMAKAVLKNLGIGKRGKSGKIQAAWLFAAGETLAASTRPVALSKNVLTVEVASSALMGELAGFKKSELMDRIKSAFPEIAVLDIRFRIGRF